MADTTKSALELLEQLQTEREELDALISGLEKRLGIAPQPRVSEKRTASSPRDAVSPDSISVGFFHRLSQPKAAEKLLRMNPGQPLSTHEIIDAFRKSGMNVNPKNAVTVLYTALKRNPEMFERVAKKKWGLTEWYGSNRKRRERDESSSSTDESE